MTDDDAKKHDILSDLLSNAQSDETLPDAEDLNTLLYRDPKELEQTHHRAFRLTDLHAELGPAGRAALLDEAEDREPDMEYRSFRLSGGPRDKKKATIYFPNKLHIRLRSAKHQAKKLAPEELRSHVTMSDIVTIALRIALREFEMKGKNSLMLKLLMKNIQRKM